MVVERILMIVEIIFQVVRLMLSVASIILATLRHWRQNVITDLRLKRPRNVDKFVYISIAYIISMCEITASHRAIIHNRIFVLPKI